MTGTAAQAIRCASDPYIDVPDYPALRLHTRKPSSLTVSPSFPARTRKAGWCPRPKSSATPYKSRHVRL